MKEWRVGEWHPGQSQEHGRGPEDVGEERKHGCRSSTGIERKGTRRNNHCWAIAHGYLNLVSSTWVINLFVFPSSALPAKRAIGQIRGGDFLVDDPSGVMLRG